MSRTRGPYTCVVQQQAGFGVEWTETSLRAAMRETRERVQAGYSNDEDGTVDAADGQRLACWVNVSGRAERRNV